MSIRLSFSFFPLPIYIVVQTDLGGREGFSSSSIVSISWEYIPVVFLLREESDKKYLLHPNVPYVRYDV